MAPKTPQANSKLPKPPTAGGPVSLTGIPAPASVLQRRSFLTTPASSSVSKAFKDMTPEQQALLAEAISIHSPAPGFSPTPPTAHHTSGHASGFGHFSATTAPSSSALGFGYPQQPPSPVNNDRASPTGLTSPLTHRTSQISRRPSNSRLGMVPEASTPAPYNNGTLPSLANTSATTTTAAGQQQQLSRPASYSGLSSPLSTSNPNLPINSSAPSPTPGVAPSTNRLTSSSPSGSRPTLPTSRLATGTGIAPPATTGARTSLMKQPLFQRPAGTAVPSAAPAAAAPKNPLTGITGSPVVAPPSLDNYEIGDRVIVESMALSGYLRFVGPAEFKSGTWAGIELDTPTGKNDGSVNGVTYFQCRPKCGIFVLAAKIVKSELLFPSSPELDTARPPSAQEINPPPAPTQPTQPAQQPAQPVSASHAAQAASRITAGSRASKYIGMTATQLKQRNGAPQSSVSRPLSQSQPNLPAAAVRAASPTIRALGGSSGSPTTSRTMTPGQAAAAARANSPSPVPKPALRSNSPTMRPTPGTRLSQNGAKPSVNTLMAKPGAHSRSASSTSSVTSQSSAAGSRARTSPTPRAMTTPRRLSSRSETPDATSLMSPSESRTNLLDHATSSQTVGSPQSVVSLQLQQLQLDFDTAIAENNLLKSKVTETKQQLETTKLLEKKDLSYDERAFLSKNLDKEAIEERLAQELEDLHLLKETWDKEKAAKDQEIKVVTEKMTQAWLEAARSQKERTVLIQEKTTLAEKLKEIQENGGETTQAEVSALGEEQEAMIESLKKSLVEAEEKTLVLESKLEDLTARANEEEEKLNQANAETQAAIEAKKQELQSERDVLQSKLAELEIEAKAYAEKSELTLKVALDETEAANEQLIELERRLEEESELRRLEQSEADVKFKVLEEALQEAQAQLAKSEKLTRSHEEKSKELSMVITKRDQELDGLKLQLQDLAGMVQSEEVDRMRKLWEHEKKRLEEAVGDNITVMTTLRAEILELESNEEELTTRIKTLEASETTLKGLKTSLDAEVEHLQASVKAAEDSFSQERSTLETKIAESESTLEIRLSENKERMDELEAIALTMEEWSERCEALQLEMIQKTAKVEEIGFDLSEAQIQRDTVVQELETIKAELKAKDEASSAIADHAAQLETSRAEISALEEEREQLLVKVSELEAALALSASAPRATASGAEGSEAVLNRTELEEEITGLKQMVHELTAENASVASDNKKLMQEHDILMEAHKHVETECLKLMDEVERLHSESLAAEVADKDELDVIQAGTEIKTAIIGQSELKAALNNDTAILTPTEKPGQNQSASVIRLENLLKDKQAMLDRLTQAHALEMRDLRQRYVDLDRSKAWELNQLNKELTDLESLIESKIFHEADLEEEVQQKQKQIDRLQSEVADLKSQLSKLSNGTHGSVADLPPNGLPSDRYSYSSTSILPNGLSRTSAGAERTRTVTSSTDQTTLFCEICEEEGHDIISCAAVFGGGKTPKSTVHTTSQAPIFEEDQDDDRPYCENCEEFGLHYTDECPNESLTLQTFSRQPMTTSTNGYSNNSASTMTPEVRHRGSQAQREHGQVQGPKVVTHGLDSIPSTPQAEQQQQKVLKNTPTRSPSWTSLAALTMQVSLQDWILIATMIFGGCCSNVFALEILVNDAPKSGQMITFAQFVCVSAYGLAMHLKWPVVQDLWTPRSSTSTREVQDRPSEGFWRYIPHLKKRKIPLTRWLMIVIMFFVVSVLNNQALAYKISVPLHIIFRSGGLMVGMVLGMVLMKKRYSKSQIFAVTIVTIGVIYATTSAKASSPQKSKSQESAGNSGDYAMGVFMLIIALIISSLMGLLQEDTYQKYGAEWQQFKVFNRSTPIPVLQLVRQIGPYLPSSVAYTLSSITIPRLWIFLAVNTLTQFMCISGVHRLTSLSSALTLNFILNLRKFSSLLISVLYFENGFGFEMAVGSSLVLLGTVMYSLSSSSSAAKKPSVTTTTNAAVTTTSTMGTKAVTTSKPATAGVRTETEALSDSKRQ
ncbi:golgi uridine diphosphate-N- acetylglucosamine transporter [Linnemannia gamsii]|uniref:Golgi uridine diphosphate-N- acetylglucosamine transporter n=1 Tax=Linnemannia gamsii TaxID=64522 RepID=A0ABQ7JMS9_9FUNG|nr:golgi uridine diphosphate-N- acetylglucosamine transporter [Linnemannia gamsii]